MGRLNAPFGGWFGVDLWRIYDRGRENDARFKETVWYDGSLAACLSLDSTICRLLYEIRTAVSLFSLCCQYWSPTVHRLNCLTVFFMLEIRVWALHWICLLVLQVYWGPPSVQDEPNEWSWGLGAGPCNSPNYTNGQIDIGVLFGNWKTYSGTQLCYLKPLLAVDILFSSEFKFRPQQAPILLATVCTR